MRLPCYVCLVDRAGAFLGIAPLTNWFFLVAHIFPPLPRLSMQGAIGIHGGFTHPTAITIVVLLGRLLLLILSKRIHGTMLHLKRLLLIHDFKNDTLGFRATRSLLWNKGLKLSGHPPLTKLRRRKNLRSLTNRIKRKEAINGNKHVSMYHRASVFQELSFRSLYGRFR